MAVLTACRLRHGRIRACDLGRFTQCPDTSSQWPPASVVGPEFQATRPMIRLSAGAVARRTCANANWRRQKVCYKHWPQTARVSSSRSPVSLIPSWAEAEAWTREPHAVMAAPTDAAIADLAKPAPATTARADRLQFDSLVLPHLDAAYNLARFLTRNSEAAEDIAQEALLRAFRSISGFRGGDARAWVLAIVRNCCMTWAQSTRSQPATVSLDAVDIAHDGPLAGSSGRIASVTAADQLWSGGDEDTPERALLRGTEIAEIRSMIDSLPAQFREVLVLRELEEMSYRQIAELTGSPVGTVMSRLARARQMFALGWKKQHGEDEREAVSDRVGEFR
jgi:RNA polymerase sigma factor (sigma-70 family)